MTELKILKKPTVMLVDDCAVDNFINLRILSQAEIFREIIVHHNPVDALSNLKEVLINDGAGSDRFPEFIFLDVSMPMMNGFEFVAEFEKLAQHNANRVRIIMVSSSIDPGDLEKAKTHSLIKGFVIKPLTRSSLNIVLQENPWPIVLA